MSESVATQAEAYALVVDGDCTPLVLEHLHEYAVTVEPPAEVVVVTVGEQGPPGPPGSGLSEWQSCEW